MRAAQSEETQTPDTPARRVVPLHRKRTWWRIGGVSVAALLCLTLAAGPFFFRGRLSDTEKSMGMAAPYSLMAEDEMPDEVAGDVCEANSLCLYALPTEDEDGFGYENAIPNDWPMGAEETDGGMRANSAENDCESTTGRALCMEDSAACERQACLFPGSLPATVRRSRLWPRPVGSVRP